MIDCGEPLTRVCASGGFGFHEVDRIILSHTHCDHIGGFFMFMQALWLQKRVKRLYIHLPEDAIEPVRAMLNACYLFPDLFHFKAEYIPLRAGEPIVLGRARVTPFATTHLQVLRDAYHYKYPQSFAAFSFLIESENHRVGHSADLGGPEDLAPLLDQPLDLLLCEVAHFKPKNLFRFLRDKPVKRILFKHVAREYWERLSELKATAREMLRGMNWSFARDGQEVQIN